MGWIAAAAVPVAECPAEQCGFAACAAAAAVVVVAAAAAGEAAVSVRYSGQYGTANQVAQPAAGDAGESAGLHE